MHNNNTGKHGQFFSKQHRLLNPFTICGNRNLQIHRAHQLKPSLAYRQQK
ncbi:Uncharacterised protein [Streptococcus pneumoniae]|nr:Uncharacterised protein [Streptococcus pneumoniae]